MVKTITQIVKEIDEVVQIIPQECISERISEQIVDMPVPQFWKIIEVIKFGSSGSSSTSNCGADYRDPSNFPLLKR